MGTIVCFGELLLRLGAPGRQMLLQSPVLDVHVGGAEANVAVSLARFGHDARMVGVVADNALGEAALGELRRHRVDTRAVQQATGRMGLYFFTPRAIQRPSEVLYDRADSAFARIGGGTREDGVRALLSEKQPSLRMTLPAEIGALAVFLCRREAHNITGTAMPVDGGWTAQ